MSRAARLASLVFVLTLASPACAVQHYQVIASSNPSALHGLSVVWLQYDYSYVAISKDRMSEADWLATREKDDHRQIYLETKDAVNLGFAEGLANALAGTQINPGQAPAGGIQITVSYLEWEEGMYAGVVSWPSRATARVIFSRDGQTVDEIEVRTGENASVFTPAPQQRFHTCGRRLGQYAAEYIAAVR